MWKQIAEDLFRWTDSCHVYVLRRRDEALAVDAGAGRVADHLADIGVRRVRHVLHTHHHRDQCEGSSRLRALGAQIWAPETESELMGDPEGMWQGRPLLNSYSGRSDRAAPLQGLPLAGTLDDYAVFEWEDVRLRVLPTPGHTMGSSTLLWDSGSARIAFTGDLIFGPGKVWSLATFQYDYNGHGGASLNVRSLRSLAAEAPGLLLPSHGEPMSAPTDAIAATERNLLAFVRARSPKEPDRIDALDRPLEVVTPHLLRDVHSVSSNWAVLSDDGHAVWIDYGYPCDTYITAAGGDRGGKRPVLHGLEQLRMQFGVHTIDAVIVTHHHDDHVAAIRSLRRATGAEVWASEQFADVLEHPSDYKTQCLWYDPIPVDRVMRNGEPFVWRGIAFTAHPQPGHTRYAACIDFQVDGRRCVAIGDQFTHNYIYANQFALGDYPATVELWRALAPDLILPGHGPAHDGPRYIADFAAVAEGTDAMHRALLPLEQVDFGAGGQAAEVRPYHVVTRAGQAVAVTVRARNPWRRPATLRVRLALQPGLTEVGWSVEPKAVDVDAPALGTGEAAFTVTPGRLPARRARYGVDLEVGGRPFGLVDEGFVTVAVP